MHIVQLTPGSGDNFYCENCLRDLTLVRAMRRLGHEVTLVPMYLPLEIRNPTPMEAAPIFFGGINVYLQQKVGLFRKTPMWLDRWLDSPLLLRPVAKLSSMTRARDLGQTTLSMLEGDNGRQKKEVERLVDWLKTLPDKPDIILLSNALLSGLAGPLRRQLGRPVVCLLQDEDGFLDGLGQPWAQRAWEKVKQNTSEINHFIAVSRYFAEVMTDRLGLRAEKVSVIMPGIEVNDFRPAAEPPDEPTIGFLARLCHDNGLDILINALFMLRRDERFRQARLMVTGGSLHSDGLFLRKVKRRIEALSLSDFVLFESDYTGTARKKFLNSLSVISVPTRKPMAYGLFAIEAMACGVPFIEPDCGVFSELAQLGAGVVYPQNNPVHLAETLRDVLSDAPRLSALRRTARQTAEKVFDVDHTAAQMVACFQDLSGQARRVRTYQEET
jgi:glycosyltransferase involved in cell wall biosynthesis